MHGRRKQATLATVHQRDGGSESPHGGKRMEFTRSGEGIACLYPGQFLAKPGRVRPWPPGDYCIPETEVGKELDYRLIKEVWAYTDNRIAVRFAYEWHDDAGNWFRSYGNENWEFAPNGQMQRRFASINDLPIKETDRKYHWPLGPRPENHPDFPTSVCNFPDISALCSGTKYP